MPGNLYRRGATWWARVSVGGKEQRRSLRTTDRKEARKRLATFLAEANHARFYGETRHTWADAVAGYFDSGQVKESTATRYRWSAKSLHAYLDGKYVDQIDRKMIGDVARRPGVSNATRRRDLTALSSILNWCVGEQWLDHNVAGDWSRRHIPENREPIALPSVEDIDAIVDVAPKNFAALLRCLQFTGMRREEAASLEWSQVDFDRSAINLTTTKTRRARSVPLDARALRTIRGTERKKTVPFVFWHDPGDRYRHPTSQFGRTRERVNELRREAKAPLVQFRIHDLRHWFAVDYLRRGGSIYNLSKHLGHTSVKTTEIYLDFLTPDEATTSRR